MEDIWLYVTAQGAKLTRIGERLVVRSREGAILDDVPLFRVRQVLCFGSVEATHAVLTTLFRRDIDLVWVTVDGRFRGRLSHFRRESVTCRLEQYRRFLLPEARLAAARAVVAGKLATSRTWLLRQNRTGNQELGQMVLGVGDCLAALPEAANVDALMGLEGTAARWHFAGLKAILKQDLGFRERERRPPPDPVNAMLSFGYTLLLQRVLSAVEQAGLDPMIGNLHALQDRRPSLALDLMEEFRTVIVDSVVTRLVNQMEATPADFVPVEDRGVRMQEGMLGRFVQAFQARLAEAGADPVDGRRFPWKDLIVRQALQYKAFVLGERPEYQPVRIR
ncbi:MAG: CRISPR-associated endonuclease Cas1 [Candidatus Riflebacteria bacterium]|nr:CRISPR-associated endonuclease Cas1 [Candidatus Riflebacteria bacterium]